MSPSCLEDGDLEVLMSTLRLGTRSLGVRRVSRDSGAQNAGANHGRVNFLV